MTAGQRDPSDEAASRLDDLKREVNKIADESSDSKTDTHELAQQLWLAIDDGGSVAQVVARASAVCSQAYETVE